MKALDSQDAFLFRHLKKAREQSELLVPEGGPLDPSVSFLKRFTYPVANQLVETYIREALDLPEEYHITTTYVRRAVLSAFLMPLRQSVGSCFATAPAILVQQEQQGQFFQDLFDLIYTGRLKRVIKGKEYAVPLCHTSGFGNLMKKVKGSYLVDIGLLSEVKEPDRWQSVGDWLKGAEDEKRLRKVYCRMTDHALLKAWEYTVASFTDYKTDFFKWNLYAALGFKHQDRGGIGELIYDYMQQRLDASNEATKNIHDEYEAAYNHLRAAEVLLARASSYEEARRLKSEVQASLYHFHSLKEMRDDSEYYAEKFSRLYQFLIEAYCSHLEAHFQEIFDPEIIDPNPTLYDDEPAGFRLVYKHGRSDPSQWTLIQDKETFVSALTNFFRMTENQIVDKCDWKKGKKEIEEITTLVIQFLRSPEFMRGSLKESPWQYISGGSMHTLVKGYYSIENELQEEARPVDNPADLFMFLLDVMKGLSSQIVEPFLDNAKKSFLMHSPTHAFLFKPGMYPFKLGWLDKGLSYIWIRDYVIHPAQVFYSQIMLNEKEQEDLLYYLGLSKVAPSPERLTLKEFRSILINHMPAPKIDAFFRGAFPLKSREAFKHFSVPPTEFVPYQMYRGLFPDQELEAPVAVLFADTNWTPYFFGFVVNPATLELELWRMDEEGFLGAPMDAWDPFFGKDPWGVLTNPRQYTRNL